MIALALAGAVVVWGLLLLAFHCDHSEWNYPKNLCNGCMKTGERIVAGL